MRRKTAVFLAIIMSLMISTSSYAKITDELAVRKADFGNGFGIALLNNGTVLVWGNLNDDMIISKPVIVDGINNVKDISCGNNFCAILKNDGLVYLIGNSNWVEEATFFNPVKLDGLSNIKEISSGSNFILGLDNDKDVYSIGENTSGQLGIGSTLSVDEGKKIDSINKINSVSAGYDHSYALDEDGMVWSWGNNEYGQLSRGVNGGIYKKPGKSAGLKNIKEISSSKSFSIFLRNDGLLYGVGLNENGQLGLGDYENRTLAEKLTELNKVKIEKISTGAEHSIAVSRNTRVYTWGNSTKGQLGREDENFNLPGMIDLKGGIDIFAGGNNSAVLKADRRLWVSGDNIFGQLGDEIVLESKLLNSLNITDISAFATGDDFAFAVNNKGLYGWGLNYKGQINSSGNEVISSPVLLDNASNISFADGGEAHTVLLDKSKNVYSLGDNTYYQLGVKSGAGKVKIEGISSIEKITAGSYHNLALNSSGKVYSWGKNSSGQLGNEDYSNVYNPIEVNGLSDIVEIKAGEDFSIALDKNGYVWVWGSNQYGQLGFETDGSNVPVKLDGLSNIQSIFTGKFNVSAVDKNGDVWVWGYNLNKEFGIEDEIISKPLKLTDISNVKKVCIGDKFTAFLEKDGKVKIIGDLKVEGNFENVKDIDSGLDFLVVQKNDNKLYTAGNNHLGQLGLGSNNINYEFSLSSVYKENNTGIIVLVNLNELEFDVDPIIRNSRTLVPLRGIFEYLDVNVEWDGDTRTVTCEKEDKKVTVKIDSDIAIVDGEEIKMDTKAIIKDNRTLIPLRFISESLGAYVDWDSESRTVIVVE